MTPMEWLDTQAMLWFAGRWWWFPGRRISAESQFEILHVYPAHVKRALAMTLLAGKF